MKQISQDPVPKAGWLVDYGRIEPTTKANQMSRQRDRKHENCQPPEACNTREVVRRAQRHLRSVRAQCFRHLVGPPSHSSTRVSGDK